MSKEREALKLALEALESAEPKYTKQRADQKTLGGSLDYWKLAQHQRLKAVTAIKEALAQPEQEPVAWMEKDVLPLTHIIKAIVRREKDETYTEPLYTTPPQRKPLTDEQICPWFQENTALTNEAAMRITRAIEAAHGIKD